MTDYEVITTGKTVDDATEKACERLGKSRGQVTVEILQLPTRRLFRSVPAKVQVTVLESERDEVETKEPAAKAAPVEEKPAAKPAAKEAKPQEKKEVKAAPAKKPTAPKPAPAKDEAHQPQKPIKPHDSILTQKEPMEKLDLNEHKPAAEAVDYLVDIFKKMGSKTVVGAAYQQGDATLIKIDGDDIRDIMDVKGNTIQALSFLTDQTVNRRVNKNSPEYIRIRLDVAGYRRRRENELVAMADRISKEVRESKRSKTLPPMNPYERLIVHTAVSEMDEVKSESVGSDNQRRVVIRSTHPDATEGDNRQQRGGGQRRKNQPQRKQRPKQQQAKPASQPQRKPAEKAADQDDAKDKKPVVPRRTDSVEDGKDLPLYGKIEL